MSADPGPLPGSGGRIDSRDALTVARRLRGESLPKVVATDLDGTLLRTDGALSRWTEQVLRGASQAGVQVVFVTARPPRWVDHFADLVGEDGIILCANGAFVYDVRSRRVVEEHTIPENVLRELVADLRTELPGVVFGMERVDGLALEPEYISDYVLPPDAPKRRAEDLFDLLPGKLLARCPGMDPTEFHDRVEAVVGQRCVLSYSGAVGLAEIGAAEVTKAAALTRWTGGHGFAATQVWAFGDMPNDLPMLGWAGMGVAVSNAHPVVLEAADLICPSNDEDGVAQVIGVIADSAVP